MSVNDPPQFISSIFNNTAFIDTTETLTLGDANNLYLKKTNPSATGNLSMSGTLTNVFAAGKVGIGISNPSYQFQVSTDSAAKPSTNTWTVSSDIRIKEDIQDADLDICYNNVKNLKLKRYKWIDEFIENHSIEDKHKLGWIAQEVETVIPKAVTTINNKQYNIEDFKSLNSDQIYASMYGAIQKLINKIENIENFISTLDIEE